MLGKQKIVIDSGMFARGMASGPKGSDGGFSTEGYINPIALRSYYCPPGRTTNFDVNLTGGVVASCEDPLGSAKRCFTANDGTFYTYDGTTLSLKQTDDTVNAQFNAGTCDMVAYNGDIFVTKQNSTTDADMVRLYGSPAMTSINKSWWKTTMSEAGMNQGVRHPMVRFDRFLWVGDLNNLHKIEGTAANTYTVSVNALVLPLNLQITALGVEPGSGLMLIATTSAANYSGTLQQRSMIHTYDGNSSSVRKTIELNDIVTGFYSLGGTTYVTYGQNLGKWNGSGIDFLRALNIGLTGAELAYKHHISSFGNTLLIAEGTKVLAYGHVDAYSHRLVGREAAFYYVNGNQDNSNTITCLANIGSGKIAMAYDTNKMAYFDITSSSTQASLPFYSQHYDLPGPSQIRWIDVHFKDNVTASTNIGTLSLIDDDGTHTVGTVNTANNDGTHITDSIFRFPHSGSLVDTTSAQLYWTPVSTSSWAAPVHKFVIYYDANE